jgi:lipoic acid synthetase
VTQDDPEPVDPEEPAHVADAVRRLNLRHVVVTSVTRDDLPDGGAGHFAEIVRRIHALDQNSSGRKVLVEVLIPDFGGRREPLQLVVDSEPDVLNHNVETVPRLYDDVRPMADYRRSLTLLERGKAMNCGMTTKSGIMAGLGETDEEVLAVLRDLRTAGCDFLTIGQYLAPSTRHYPVQEYVHPDTFEMYREKGLEMGFRAVASGPFVRSSYHAGELYRNVESSDC